MNFINELFVDPVDNWANTRALCSFLDVYFKEAQPHIVFSEEKEKGFTMWKNQKFTLTQKYFVKSIYN